MDINTIIHEGLSTDHLLQWIQESETVQAAIVESVHRFYHDMAFNPYTERPFEDAFDKISNIHSTLQCSLPSWRVILRKLSERYEQGNREGTNAIHVGGKPKELIKLKIKIEYYYDTTNTPGRVLLGAAP